MTVGEKIQMYRKQHKMSQEELGQKMRVSRQTISLWETNQTVPTIDNLIRLKEIFGASVDDILGLTGTERNPDLPNETYRFHFPKEEVDEIYHLQKKIAYKKPIRFALICLFLIIGSIATSASGVVIAFSIGMFFIGMTSHMKGIQAYNRTWKKNIEQISKKTYEYNLFDDHIMINIYCGSEKVRESKCAFTDIERIELFDRWLILQYGGQAFLLRRAELNENSAFYSYMYKNPAKTVEKPIPSKWDALSVFLFIASIVSIFCALILVAMMSEANGLFVENMWVFFLLTPIPISSFILGCYLKSKGYKYKKNIVVGVIMTVLLCIYGSFSIIF